MTQESAATVQAWAAVASLVVTVSLAGFTLVYVWLTKRVADQMVKQAEPVVIGRIEPLFQAHVQFVISNVGLGPALDIESSLALSSGTTTTWRHALFEPGRSESFLVPVTGGPGGGSDALKDLAERDALLTSIIRYKDRGGRPYQRTDKTGFKEILESWNYCHWNRPDDEIEKLGDIEAAVAQLTKEVAKIPKVMSR
jgi:hypothetical protein